MCGIAGIARSDASAGGVTPDVLATMAASLRHRGPDGYGFFSGARVGLAHVRLSIIDIARGAQPLTNEDGQVLIVYNGEVYNYRELRPVLERLGHVFRTDCDTEVLVHGYEEWGPAMLGRLNGQFAFAIYDRRTESIFLARDRFGVRPLFYAERNGTLYFASEIKALFATGELEAAPDYAGLDEVFTLWAARPPRTVFRDVKALEPGCWARWERGALQVQRYYELEYPVVGEEAPDALARLDDLMRSSVDFRMRADVPVGGYLSGGLDSSITCALAAAASPYTLRTFSVTFDDPRYDESAYQRTVAEQLGSEHAMQHIGGNTVANVFPAVVWHAETPLVRTAPAPMYLLSRVTRDGGIKVVLTGEGSDELFLGYDLFKETVVREFCLRQPGSRQRPRLFDRLYPYLHQSGEFWRQFFLNAGSATDPLFSHLPRIRSTSRIKEFYTRATRDALIDWDAEAALRDSLPASFPRWSVVNRAAYLEMATLLSPYLLSSQGDRMGMAHGVEGRFPFLDHRLFEFAAALPERSKLEGLREKAILRRWAAGVVPPVVRERTKQPYRAPDTPAFFAAAKPDYVDAMLQPDALRRSGIFESAAVAGLVRRCQAGLATGAREGQALVAVLSTQLWYHAFIDSRRSIAPLPLDGADVLLSDELAIAQ